VKKREEREQRKEEERYQKALDLKKELEGNTRWRNRKVVRGCYYKTNSSGIKRAVKAGSGQQRQKSVGVYEVDIHLFKDVWATVKVKVEKE